MMDQVKVKPNIKPKKAAKSSSGRVAKAAYERETRLYFESIRQLPILFIEVKKIDEPYVFLDIRNLIVLLLYETFKLDEWVKLSVVCNVEQTLSVGKNVLRLRTSTVFKQRKTLSGSDKESPDLAEIEERVNNCHEIISSKIHPSVTISDKRMVICGVSSVLRFIIKFVCYKLENKLTFNDQNFDLYKTLKQFLGFRGGCLQACAESSIWTKFCEVDMITGANELFALIATSKNDLSNRIKVGELPTIELRLPESLLRFEYHLSLPVKIHNFRKVAQDIRKTEQEFDEKIQVNYDPVTALKHDFAEGPVLLLSDLILYPSVHVCMLLMGRRAFELILPKTLIWYDKLHHQFSPEVISFVDSHHCTNLYLKNSVMINFSWSIPNVPFQSLYSRDTNRYKPSLRQFTRQHDVDEALDFIKNNEVESLEVHRDDPNFNWAGIPPLAHPEGGSLPISRRSRKRDQLASMAFYVLQVYSEKKLQPDFDSESHRFRIVDFCSGGGHVGILVAYLLPECEVILVENKDESLRRAQERISGLNLANVFCYQSNLDYFEGKFDLGIALHACGTATDLVLQKCVSTNASFVCCPCCYGAIQENHVLSYPRSSAFKQSKIPLRLYFTLCHSADQTHDEAHEKTTQGKVCMTLIDTDRCWYAADNCYNVKLCKIVPETASPKNHILVGVSKIHV